MVSLHAFKYNVVPVCHQGPKLKHAVFKLVRWVEDQNDSRYNTAQSDIDLDELVFANGKIPGKEKKINTSIKRGKVVLVHIMKTLGGTCMIYLQ